MMQIIKEFVVDQYINKGVILKQKRHDNFNGKCLSLGVYPGKINCETVHNPRWNGI